MKKYLAIFKMKLIESFVEREITIIWAVSRIIALAIILSVWMASDSDMIGSFTKKELLSYYFILFLLDPFIGLEVFWEMRRQIMSGTIANVLLKPVSYITYLLSRELGFKIIEILIRLALGMILYLSFINIISINIDLSIILKFIPAIFIAFFIEFFLSFSFGTLAFIWTEPRFINDFKWVLFSFLGGRAVPLALFPKSLLNITKFNPFRFTCSFPLEVALNKVEGETYYLGIFVGLLYLIFFFLLARISWKFGLKRYSAFGS